MSCSKFKQRTLGHVQKLGKRIYKQKSFILKTLKTGCLHYVCCTGKDVLFFNYPYILLLLIKSYHMECMTHYTGPFDTCISNCIFIY
jgi:hypothetical protein